MRKVTDRQYARALVAAAETVTEFDQLMQDLKDVNDKLDESIDFAQLLRDEHVPLPKKKAALEAVFKDFISKKTYNALLLLIRAKKLAALPTILEQAQHEHLSLRDTVIVTVESVVALSGQHEKDIASIIKEKIGKNVVIHPRINPELIGGLRIRVGDRVIDGSIQGKIERLHKQIESLI